MFRGLVITRHVAYIFTLGCYLSRSFCLFPLFDLLTIVKIKDTLDDGLILSLFSFTYDGFYLFTRSYLRFINSVGRSSFHFPHLSIFLHFPALWDLFSQSFHFATRGIHLLPQGAAYLSLTPNTLRRWR